METQKTRWAFLSVQDTTGIVDFARGLVERNFKIVATPGTMEILKAGGIEAEPIDDITGFPLILSGLVKSMHPRIIGGILADRNDAEAVRECEKYSVPLFDLVAVNCTLPALNAERSHNAENLRIAPGMLLRAAATRYDQVLVVTNPQQYPGILVALSSPHGPAEALRRELAREAWTMAIHHDLLVARALDEPDQVSLPPVLRLEYRKVLNLRYGENPHQHASLYASSQATDPSVARARLVAGTPLSYNNIVDADVSFSLASEFAAPGTVIVKHAMPVSAAVGGDTEESVRKCFAAEWASRIGAAVACNDVIDEAAAQAIAKPGRSIDLIIATDFTPAAVKMLRQSEELQGEVRLLKAGTKARPAGTGRRQRVAIHHVSGGILAQTVDDGVYGPGGFHVVSRRTPSDEEMVDLEFACLIAKHTRSHAVVLAYGGATIAVASVQTSLAEAAHIALERGGNRTGSTVMASDGQVNLAQVAMLAEAGVRAIIHTGGTDDESVPLVQACDQYDIAMLVTCMRHYSHV